LTKPRRILYQCGVFTRGWGATTPTDILTKTDITNAKSRVVLESMFRK
jgi:hypothetical protein